MRPIGKVIRQRRLDVGFKSSAALAKKAGIPASTLRGIENGVNPPSYWALFRLMLALEPVELRVETEDRKRRLYYQGYRDGKSGRKPAKRYAYENGRKGRGHEAQG